MKLKIVPFRLLIIASLVIFLQSNQLLSQIKILTVDEAVTISLKNFPEIQGQHFEIDRAEGQLKHAKLFPNPTLSFYNERLESGSINAGESIISINQPLSFLWTRSSQIEKTTQSINEQKLLYEDKLRLFKYEVKRAYIMSHLAEMNHETLQSISSIFDRINTASEDRLKEGDISGYDRTRISAEHLKYLKSLKEMAIDHSSKDKMLKYFLGQSAEESISTAAPPLKDILISDLQKIVTSSFENRTDLKALEAGNKSKMAGLEYARRSALPHVSIQAGYKKQVDDFSGSIFQFNVNLPVFNRNQGEIINAEVGLRQHSLKTEQLKQIIRLEVETATNKYLELCGLSEKYSETTKQFFESLLTTAQNSYSEGEMTLVEFIDALNAYTDLQLSRNELLQNLYLSIYELELVTGIEFQ